jgi:hypothetical protein
MAAKTLCPFVVSYFLLLLCLFWLSLFFLWKQSTLQTLIHLLHHFDSTDISYGGPPSSGVVAALDLCRGAKRPRVMSSKHGHTVFVASIRSWQHISIMSRQNSYNGGARTA